MTARPCHRCTTIIPQWSHDSCPACGAHISTNTRAAQSRHRRMRPMLAPRECRAATPDQCAAIVTRWQADVAALRANTTETMSEQQ